MSKLEEARQIQQDAGLKTGRLIDPYSGCVCPLGALAKAYGVEINKVWEENKAYSGVSEEHKQDLALLGTAAQSRFKKRRLALVKILTDSWQVSPVQQLAARVWNYNDCKIQTNQQAVNLFTKAIEIRDSGVQILEEGVEL